MKTAHDKQILRKNFEPNQRVHLYDSRLHLHPGKLRSRWTDPFVVKQVFPNGAVEIEDRSDGRVFRVNGQRLKHYIEQVPQAAEITLVAPIYHPWVFCFQLLYIILFFFVCVLVFDLFFFQFLFVCFSVILFSFEFGLFSFSLFHLCVLEKHSRQARFRCGMFIIQVFSFPVLFTFIFLDIEDTVWSWVGGGEHIHAWDLSVPCWYLGQNFCTVVWVWFRFVRFESVFGILITEEVISKVLFAHVPNFVVRWLITHLAERNFHV